MSLQLVTGSLFVVLSVAYWYLQLATGLFSKRYFLQIAFLMGSGILGAWFAFLVLVITPIKMWRHNDCELEKLSSKTLEFIYDESIPTCKMTEPTRKLENGQTRPPKTTIRIGVRGLGQIDIDDCEVLLQEFTPQKCFIPTDSSKSHAFGA